MPWVKAIPNMKGYYTLEMGRCFKSADECMDSFDSFERDSSFGPKMTCRPVFFPINDEELAVFYEMQKKASEKIEVEKKNQKVEELADTLLGLFKNINKCLDDRK